MREDRVQDVRISTKSTARGFNLPRFLLAMVIGFVALPLFLTKPAVVTDFFRSGYEAIIAQTELAPEQYAQYINIGLIVVAIIFIMMFRGYLGRTLLSVSFVLGVLIGAFVWIPFGVHIHAAAPEVAEIMPTLQQEIDELAYANQLTTQAKGWAEETFPVPTEQSGAPVAADGGS